MFILKIPEPCHENWEDMSPENKGRFCGSCQKIVVDFTQMSDEQVKRYLLDNANKNTCGRFLATQIGRPFENKSIHIDPVWYQQLPFARQVFYAFAVFFVLGVSSCDISMGDSDKKEIVSIHQNELKGQNTGTPLLNEADSVRPIPPKSNIVKHTGPILTGDVAITEPGPVRELQGAPIWQEEPNIDTTKMITGKIKAPLTPKIDSAKVPEPMIMGGIAAPLPLIKDSSTHKKPRR